jgi:glyoxylase-like metal-dependent hydrolase (beta-lactamase superfamily II)
MTAALPQMNQFRLGSLKFTVVRDGANILEKPWETFGVNKSPETVQKRLAENFLPTDRLVNTYAPAIIETESDLIVVDTGFGAAARSRGSGMLMSGLKAAGYEPGQVSLVILTHLHGDHIGGLMEAGAPSFPNARYVTGEAEYAFWSDAARLGTPAEGSHQLVMSNVAPFAERLILIKDGDQVARGITAIHAPGHTPGHMAFHIESEGARLVMTGDAVNHYILSLEEPDWEVRFDMDKTEAARTRRRLLDMIATDRIAFLGYHMPFPAVGFVEKRGTGFRYVPKTYQFDF